MNRKDLTGKRFGRLVAVEPTTGRLGHCIKWRCLCDCGKEKDISSVSLTSGDTKSCGCIQKIDPTRTHKKCGLCHIDKPITEFHRNKKERDGHTERCKSCRVVSNKSYAPKTNSYYRERRNSDIGFKIKTNLRNRVCEAIRGKTKSAKTMELLGCDVDYLKFHLESQFDENMSWSNYGSYWHIDHIKPCAAFDLTQESEQQMCFHYSNLQPLEAIENIRKGDKW